MRTKSPINSTNPPAAGDTAAAGTPPLPPSPLLPVPQSKIAQRPGVPSLVQGLSAPTQAQRQGREKAKMAREAVVRIAQTAQDGLGRIKVALSTQEADAAEWEREGVDASLVRAFADELEGVIKKYTTAG